MPKSSKNKHQIIESAIEKGLIGAALGALLTGKSRGAMAAGLLGAAIGASLKALEEAKSIDVAYLYEENGSIWRQLPNGDVEFVKDLPASLDITIPSRFSIE